LPLACNTAARAPFWLDADASSPISTRAVFLVKFLTTAELQRYNALLEQIASAPDDLAAYKLAREALGVGIVGWRNMNYPVDHPEAGKPMPFDLDLLFSAKVLSEQELWVLVRLYPSVVRPVEADLRNLEQPQRADREPSAASANPAA
jgi:hypothetical protein